MAAGAAEMGELVAAERPGEDVREVEYTNAGEGLVGSVGHGSSVTGWNAPQDGDCPVQRRWSGTW